MSLQHGERRRLPNRRQTIILPVRHRWPPAQQTKPDEWMDLHIGIDDGRILEVFIEIDQRKNLDLQNLYHDIATTISIALQYGAPLDVLAGAVGRTDVSMMGRHEVWTHSPVGCVTDALLRTQRQLDEGKDPFSVQEDE